MQKFENVKLRSVRNIFAVNQNPKAKRYSSSGTIENAVNVGNCEKRQAASALQEKLLLHCIKICWEMNLRGFARSSEFYK